MVSSEGKSKRKLSGYVNVCAAVCLLLLVGGGLVPTSSAAPHGRGKMAQRQKRDTPDKSRWENPCEYPDPKASPEQQYTPELVQLLANKARNVLNFAHKYRDDFANKLFSYPNYEAIQNSTSSENWLRNFGWVSANDQVFPKEKVTVDHQMSEDYLRQVVQNSKQVMPGMYKSLEMIVAAWFAIEEGAINRSDEQAMSLHDDIVMTSAKLKQLLCSFNVIMRTKHLQVLLLEDELIPQFNNLDGVALVYRDTLIFLNYLAQVMDTSFKMGD